MLSALRKMFTPSPSATYHRRWPRIVMSEPAKLTIRHGDAKRALLDNICAGGACVKISERLQRGTPLDIEFRTGPSDVHSLHARVVHVLKEPRGYNWYCGLCFLDVSTAEQRRLAEYVDAERKRRELGFAMPRN